MTALLRSRQRAEEFAARVDGTGRRDGSTVAARPDDAMDRLVGVVATLRRDGRRGPGHARARRSPPTSASG